jgi:hypothetical protein
VQRPRKAQKEESEREAALHLPAYWRTQEGQERRRRGVSGGRRWLVDVCCCGVSSRKVVVVGIDTRPTREGGGVQDESVFFRPPLALSTHLCRVSSPFFSPRMLAAFHLPYQSVASSSPSTWSCPTIASSGNFPLEPAPVARSPARGTPGGRVLYLLALLGPRRGHSVGEANCS